MCAIMDQFGQNVKGKFSFFDRMIIDGYIQPLAFEYRRANAVRTGKSFFAAYIANALLKQDIPVLMTSFPKIHNSGWSFDNRAYFLSRLRDYDLLILDDQGAERDNGYALEQIYSVVDTRYRNNKPLIVTTNLKLAELKKPPNVAPRADLQQDSGTVRPNSV